MRGIVVFASLSEAIKAGFHVYDYTQEHYLVRIKTDAGFALALARKAKERS